MSARKKPARKGGDVSGKSKRPAESAAAGAGPSGAARKDGRKPGARAAAASGGSFPEIVELAELMKSHGLLEVDYQRKADGTLRVHVSRGSPARAAAVADAGAGAVSEERRPAGTGQAGVEAPAAAASTAETLHAFRSPMVGTFYRAPSPEAPPFASVGDSVGTSNVVCIIEAMKVMNEINPDMAGEIVSIEVENGEAVEFGQTLMLIRPR